MASDCQRFLEQEELCFSPDQASWTSLQTYLQRLDEFSAEHFQDVREQACCLSTRRALQVWDAAWIHYQEVRQQLEDKLMLLQAQHLSTLTVTPDGRHSDWLEMAPGERAEPGLPAGEPVAHERDPPVFVCERSESRSSRARDSIHGTVSCFNFRSEHKSRKGIKAAHGAKENPADRVQRGKHQKPIAGSATVGCQWFPWQHAGNKKSIKGSSGAERRIAEAAFSQNQQQVTQQYQDSHNDSSCSETERVQDVCPSTSESPSRTM